MLQTGQKRRWLGNYCWAFLQFVGQDFFSFYYSLPLLLEVLVLEVLLQFLGIHFLFYRRKVNEALSQGVPASDTMQSLSLLLMRILLAGKLVHPEGCRA